MWDYHLNLFIPFSNHCVGTQLDSQIALSVKNWGKWCIQSYHTITKLGARAHLRISMCELCTSMSGHWCHLLASAKEVRWRSASVCPRIFDQKAICYVTQPCMTTPYCTGDQFWMHCSVIVASCLTFAPNSRSNSQNHLPTPVRSSFMNQRIILKLTLSWFDRWKLPHGQRAASKTCRFWDDLWHWVLKSQETVMLSVCKAWLK